MVIVLNDGTGVAMRVGKGIQVWCGKDWSHYRLEGHASNSCFWKKGMGIRENGSNGCLDWISWKFCMKV